MQGTTEHDTVHLDHIWYWLVVKHGGKQIV